MFRINIRQHHPVEPGTYIDKACNLKVTPMNVLFVVGESPLVAEIAISKTFGTNGQFPPIYPCRLSVHGDNMAPEGGITLKFKDAPVTHDVSIENYYTKEVLFTVTTPMFSSSTTVNDARGNYMLMMGRGIAW
ncbi:hypothetical protein BJ742DRAFT_737450 [Cladochytrium replicatum]|nr:hypothetical protein BJ742DRAFT_737450 [Cladochytrium replicatum]